MNGPPRVTWRFWKRNRSMPKRRVKLGIDYGVSTSKIVFRDCDPSGGESCEIVLHNGCLQILTGSGLFKRSIKPLYSAQEFALFAPKVRGCLPRASKIRFLLTHRNLKMIDQRIELTNGEASSEGTRLALSPPAIAACNSYPHHGKNLEYNGAFFEFKSAVARKCCALIPISLINFLLYFFGAGAGLSSVAAFCSSASAKLEIS